MSDGDAVCDVTTLRAGDVVHYLCHGEGLRFFIEQGLVREDNPYQDGVDVHGDGWRQYVSKWLITQVVRDGQLLFERQDS